MVFLNPTENSNGFLENGVGNVKLNPFLRRKKEIEIDNNSNPIACNGLNS